MFRVQWFSMLRQGYITSTLAGFTIILILVTFLGTKETQIQSQNQKTASEVIRSQWENMGPGNPHGAAHFGTYAFKPINPLGSIDEGVSGTTGNVLFLEGHRQNEVVYSSDSQSIQISRFGKIRAAVILQLMIPLLLIFLAFNSVNTDKELGRIKLVLLHGAETHQYLLAKTIHFWLIGVVLLLITIITQWIFIGSGVSADLMVRSALMIASYMIFFWIVSALTVYLSAFFKNGAAALSTMLVVWVLWSVFIPKVVGDVAGRLEPLPSRMEFQMAMSEDRSKGIDGHNPYSEQEKIVRDSVLAVYNASDIEELPINIDGIVMQLDEEYGNMVWDKHFGALFSTLGRQKTIFQLSGIINPFGSLRSLSMGSSGSDGLHHLHFQDEAEQYRRVFVKRLNDEQAYGGSLTGDWSWQASQEFYNSIEDFKYNAPSITKMLPYYTVDIMILLAWGVFSTILLFPRTGRLTFV